MKIHKIEVRVRYEETDRMGVVYYGNYFVWFEIGRTECFRSAGLSYRELEEKSGMRLVVVNASCNYKSPATYDDLLRIETRITDTKNTSMSFAYDIYRDLTLIASGETFHVFTNSDGRPIRIPAEIKKVLESF